MAAKPARLWRQTDGRPTWMFRVARQGLRDWGVILATAVLVCLPFLVRVPILAIQNSVDPFDLLLRCHDTHAGVPFRLVKGYSARVDPAFPFPSLGNITRIETTPKGEQFEHTAYDRVNVLVATVVTTTPHLEVTPEHLAWGRRGIDAMYPPGDVAAREQVRKWGEGLFVRWWRLKNVPPIAPADGTEDEHLWFAWQRLAAGVADERDLLRLPALLREAYPNKADRATALAWAKTYHACQAAYLEQARQRGVWGAEIPEVGLPPPTETTLAWLLYQYVGLTDASRGKAEERWAAYFPPNKLELAREWGARRKREREEAGEPLPPGPGPVDLLCAVERMTGTDGYGEKCRRLADEVITPPAWIGEGKAWVSGAIQLALWGAFPNGDVFYLLTVSDPLGLHGNPWSEAEKADSTASQALEWLVVSVFVFSLAFGLRVWSLRLLPWLIGLGRNPRFLHYREQQARFTWVGFLTGYVVVPVAIWGIAAQTLAPQLRLLVPTPLRLLPGVFTAVVLGGSFVLCVNRLVGLVLIRCGSDVSRTWLDVVIGTLLAGTAMYCCGNGWISIAGFVAFAVIPELFTRRRAESLDSDDPEPAVRMSGKVRTTAVLVQANGALFEPGQEDAAALVVFTLDSEVAPAFLADVAARMFALKDTRPLHPDFQYVAEVVSDEQYVPHRRRPLPPAFTDGVPVYAADVYLPRRYLADGFLQGTSIACLITSGERGTVELLPHWVVGDSAQSAADALRGSQVVRVSRRAATAYRRLRDQEGPPGAVLRVGVRTDGTGEYLIALDQAVTESDWRVEFFGLPVAVDSADAPLLRGCLVDFDPAKGGAHVIEEVPEPASERPRPARKDSVPGSVLDLPDEEDSLPLADEATPVPPPRLIIPDLVTAKPLPPRPPRIEPRPPLPESPLPPRSAHSLPPPLPPPIPVLLPEPEPIPVAAEPWGIWELDNFLSEGEVRPARDFSPPPARLVLRGGQAVFRTGDRERRGTVVVDPEAVPPAIDITWEGQRKPICGIYMIDEEMLSLALGSPDEPRPRGFFSPPGSPVMILFFHSEPG